MSSLAELIAQKQDLEKRIFDARKAERADAIQKIKALMDEYGLSAADLNLKSGSDRTRKSSKVPAKYRDPATGSTWSGRGLQPNWLKAALGAGKQLSDFAL